MLIASSIGKSMGFTMRYLRVDAPLNVLRSNVGASSWRMDMFETPLWMPLPP